VADQLRGARLTEGQNSTIYLQPQKKGHEANVLSPIMAAEVLASINSSFISLMSSGSIWFRPAKEERIDAGVRSWSE